MQQPLCHDQVDHLAEEDGLWGGALHLPDGIQQHGKQEALIKTKRVLLLDGFARDQSPPEEEQFSGGRTGKRMVGCTGRNKDKEAGKLMVGCTGRNKDKEAGKRMVGCTGRNNDKEAGKRMVGRTGRDGGGEEGRSGGRKR